MVVYNIAKETSQIVSTIVSTKHKLQLTIRSFSYASLLLACADGIGDSYLHTTNNLLFILFFCYRQITLPLGNTLTITKTISLRSVSFLSFDTDTKD